MLCNRKSILLCPVYKKKQASNENNLHDLRNNRSRTSLRLCWATTTDNF